MTAGPPPAPAARAPLTVSCPPAAGGCAAGGATAKGAFVIDEHGGTWARYQTVAGAMWPVTTMSCPAAGTCLAAGGADPRGGEASASTLPFIASERGGRWSQATAIPGLEALGQGNRVVASQVSCGSANLCAAGGFYQARESKAAVQAWVATEIRGRWRAAEPVPGSIALNTAGIAVASLVSCSRTTCMAGGYYSSKSHQGVTSGFLAAEHGGTWGDATQVPGLARLDTDGNAQVDAVSCAPQGYCAAIGEYTSGSTLEDRMFETTRSG